MVKRMLIDATHPEETRVVVLNGNRLEEFDFESASKKQLKGNIYLAKVTRVEPSLQAAFVEYGGNRHGFLAFNEIHPDYYRIPIADREALLAEARAAEREREAAQDAEDAAHDANGSEPRDLDAAVPEEPELDQPDEPTGDAAHEAAPDAARVEDPRDDTHHHRADEPPPAWAAPPVDPAEASPHAEAATADGGAPAHAEDGAPADDGDAPARPADSGTVSVLFDTSNGSDSEPVEVLGGDALEEVAPRRHRNFRNYKIQEVIARRQIMLVQVVKEERGTKGAALTTYLSLAGRYCVLMPNTPRGGGVSRKITSTGDRKRLKGMLDELEIPEGMAVIVRTAGMERSKAEIKRDYEYLLRLWDEIRAMTLESTAPALIHEEGNLIKRSIRDLYTRDIDEVLVDGEEGYKNAKTFMKMIVPSHAKRVQPYRDPQVPLLHRYQIETQLDAIHNPTVQLKSGGYIVINQTEALVAIDVNSGRATRERHIEETALKTNLEAADEIARQVRLRDLAGLIVIDFIDMEENRNNHAVERRVKEAMKNDRARIQIGRISAFGLLELSRQRLRPSLAETSTERCPHCNGLGLVRSTESTALHVLRAIEEEGIRLRSAEIMVHVPAAIALYILNQKRAKLAETEARYGFHVLIGRDDTLVPPNYRLERLRQRGPDDPLPTPVLRPPIEDIDDDDDVEDIEEDAERMPEEGEPAAAAEHGRHRDHHEPRAERPVELDGDGARRKRRRGRRRRHHGEEGLRPEKAVGHRDDDRLVHADGDASTDDAPPRAAETEPGGDHDGEPGTPPARDEDRAAAGADGDGHKRRRRGKRGGRRRNRAEGGGRDDANGQRPPREPADASYGASDRGPAPREPEPMVYRATAEEPDTYRPVYERAPEPMPERVPEPVEPPRYAAAPSEPAPAPVEPPPAPIVRYAEPAAPSEPRHMPAKLPEGVDVVVVEQPPENPRKGWWRRLSK
ncbi:MAG: Rne/Rng family ribonuclease [Proteobacteria bacterium]|nr:Rne/Rng family ribonuclease [Pseudomonadota bacterium]